MRDMRLWRLLLGLMLAVPGAGRLQAQETGQVAGTVTNEQGQPVATASVVVQRTRLGVVTGPDGKYVIPEVPAGTRTVVARLIGFGVATQVVTVTAGQSVVADFRLTAKAIELQGPVVVGYGTQERRTVTGAVSTVKAAAATAICGSRGAKGVVLITTKGADTGGVKTQFTADAYVTGQRPYGLPTMMNPQQYLAMLQAAARYAGVSDDPASVLSAQQQAAYAAGQATDWQKLIERTGQQRSVHIGMNGISENTRFNLSGNYFDQTGTAVGFDFNRFTGNASVDHVQGRLRLGVSAQYTHSLQA